jgi:hypothetical protein
MNDERMSDRLPRSSEIAARIYLDVDNAVFISLDASIGGLRLRSKRELSVGHYFAFVFDLPDDHFVEGRGSVRWCRERQDLYEVGISFDDVEVSAGGNLEAELGGAVAGTQSDADDKRVHPRRTHTTKIYTGAIESTISDLSKDGCRLRTNEPIEPGAFLSVVISTHLSTRVKAHGKIKWNRKSDADEPDYYHGVEFWHINQSQRNHYAEFLKTRQ